MYGENWIDDAFRFVKAFISNQLARFMPGMYVKLTRRTGRGVSDESPAEIADYFRTCFFDYFQTLGVDREDIGTFLAGKQVLEYGPGDVPGTAFLMYAYGAERVACVDRFPLLSSSEKNSQVIQELLQGLSAEARARGESCFVNKGDPSSGFIAGTVDYIVSPNGLSGMQEDVDLVISRAVLEHVNDLPATFLDMYKALRTNGQVVHQVDLNSHGFHRRNRLDFLTWPSLLWDLMYSQKGAPNRWRVDRYRDIAASMDFEMELLEATKLVETEVIKEVKSHLAKPFQSVSTEDLTWLGFWLVLRKKA